MARKGTPLPFPLRERIKSMTSEGQTRRAVAACLNIARNTVSKYAAKKAD